MTGTNPPNLPSEPEKSPLAKRPSGSQHLAGPVAELRNMLIEIEKRLAEIERAQAEASKDSPRRLIDTVINIGDVVLTKIGPNWRKVQVTNKFMSDAGVYIYQLQRLDTLRYANRPREARELFACDPDDDDDDDAAPVSRSAPSVAPAKGRVIRRPGK